MRAILRSISLLVLAFLAGATLVSAQPFEGIIEFTKTTGPVVTTYRYYVKGDRIRIEVVGLDGQTVFGAIDQVIAPLA